MKREAVIEALDAEITGGIVAEEYNDRVIVKRDLLRAALALIEDDVPPTFPEKDQSKPTELQGLYHKFHVERVFASEEHKNCRYFVIDMDHDQFAKPAMLAYARACEKSHPDLAVDLNTFFTGQTHLPNPISHMVDRFLGWTLPPDFYPDCYISFDREKANQNKVWPIGTNLFTWKQAWEMIAHMMEGIDG